jgi:hypothetical protein
MFCQIVSACDQLIEELAGDYFALQKNLPPILSEEFDLEGSFARIAARRG